MIRPNETATITLGTIPPGNATDIQSSSGWRVGTAGTTGGTIEAGEAWRSMGSAPRDGTVIEIRQSYGIQPWFGLFKWVVEKGVLHCPAGGGECVPDPGGWKDATNPNRGVFGEDTMSWRPYGGSAAAYRDPTNGAQFTSQYWRTGARRGR
jgi:hypothetical protein